jgi:ketosteroid isomerase-like protein
MLTEDFARHFAQEWIDSWNAHDLDRILSHYTDDFSMSSPFIALMGVDPSGELHGKPAVAAYWKRALERLPDLHFELIQTFVSANSVAVLYKAVLGKTAVEIFAFNDAGKVKAACGHYDKVGM